MAKIRVTFQSYDWHKYSSSEEARAAGALQEFDKEMHDMSQVQLYSETLMQGMKLCSSVLGVESPMLIVQRKRDYSVGAKLCRCPKKRLKTT